ncbi:mCG145301, partial [Mus musculus]
QDIEQRQEFVLAHSLRSDEVNPGGRHCCGIMRSHHRSFCSQEWRVDRKWHRFPDS